ncbi:MAG: iron-sulfur cluster assembly accessory protein [Sandaracinaceae bacterium]|nr:iron-sulfur cluster assembly accessory protein [Sandaracinaceae bacterium]
MRRALVHRARAGKEDLTPGASRTTVRRMSDVVETEEAPITVTPRAIEMGKQKLAEDGGSHVGIRVGVKGGGCSGLSYHFELADSIREGRDHVMRLDGLTLLVDKRSIKYLKGSVLDWNDGLVEYGFRWKNPNAKKDCGCGSSFSV